LRIAILFILISVLMLPFWLTLSTKVTAVQGPIKLWEFIHPTYYVGLSAALAALLTLMLRRRSDSRYKAITHPLFIALIIAMYMRSPALALFQYPFSDHSCHVTPIYWILRNHDIYWPKHLGHPETVSPQLTMAVLMMVTNENSVFMLHRISLLVLLVLTITYMYMLSRSVGLTKAYAAATAVLALALTYQLYYFLRQTYTMPIYVLVAYLIMRSIENSENRKYLAPLIILILAFISMDPAFVLITILALVAYPMMQVLHSILLKLRGVTENIEIRSTSLVAIISILLFGLYMLWIFSRYPYQPRDLYHIAQHAWNTAMRALHEPSTLTPETPYYWGKPTALGYNQYYSTLYKIKVFTRTTCIILGAITTLLILAGKGKRSRNHAKYLLILSYFVVTVIIIVAKAYGATFAPWTALMCYSLSLILLTSNSKKNEACILITLVVIALTLTTIVNGVHMVTALGQRVSLQDVHMSLWLGRFSPHDRFHVWTPFAGYDIDHIAYIIGNYRYAKGWYIPYEGLTEKTIEKVSQFDKIVLAKTMIYKFFEKTNMISSLPEFLTKLTVELSRNHNLVYASGLNTIDNSVWVKPR